MSVQVVDWRQHRRAKLEASIEIRSLDSGVPSSPIVARTKSVSLAGCYVVMNRPVSFSIGSTLSCQIVIPREATRNFPFTRIAGKGRVVRIDDPVESSGQEGSMVGIGIAFSRDTTSLGTIRGFAY